MIDVHCHLLPGLDDGPRSWEAALGLVDALLAQGVTTVVATPHVSHRYPNTRDAIVRELERLRERVGSGHAIEVIAAAEVSSATAFELETDELARHALGGVYLLVEPPQMGGVDALRAMTSVVASRGLTPVVVHPERMPEVARDPGSLSSLHGEGVRFQVNATSLVERHGRRRHAAWALVRSGVAAVVASDAHGPDLRPPLMATARSRLRDRLGAEHAEYLTRTVPAALVGGRPLPCLPGLVEPPRRNPLRRFMAAGA